MSKILYGKLIYINNLTEDVIHEANSFLENKTNLSEINFEKTKNWECNVVTTRDSHHNIINAEELLNFKLEILKHCDLYMRQNNDFYDGFIDGSWFNKYYKDYYQEFHRHDHKIYQHFSGVVYLTDNNSDINFFINDTFKYTPKKGNILIFDSQYEHRVLANKNDNTRMSFAFNFRKCIFYD